MSKPFIREITVATALLACAAAPSALAAQRGFYLGAGVGAYTIKVDDLNFDDDSLLLRGFAGFRLNDYWAVEGDYGYLSESKDDVLGTDVEVDFRAYTVSVRPILPVSDALDLYARAGWTWYDAKADVAGFPSIDGSDDDFTWGGGIDFHFGDLLTVRGDVSRIELDDADLNLISAALILRF